MEKEYRTVKLSSITPYPNNPRINDQAVDDVLKSIKQCGYIAPIIVDENGTVLAGHTRLKALEQLHSETAEVLIVSGLNEDQKKKYRLLDNKLDEEASWDFDLLAEELDDIDFGDLELDWGVQGFTDEELEALMSKEGQRKNDTEIKVVVKCISEEEANTVQELLEENGYKATIT